MNLQFPSQLCSLICDDSGPESKEVNTAGSWSVTGNVVPVNVGVGAESSELEIHLLGVLTTTVD